jgi:hypothetical protein
MTAVMISLWYTPSMAQSQYPGQVMNLTISGNEPQPPAIVILSHTYWIERNQYSGPVFHIAGEALNQSPDTVSSVKVIATLYDSNNRILGTEWSYLTISNNLLPNNKSPFEIVIYDSDVSNMQAVASYALAVDWY